MQETSWRYFNIMTLLLEHLESTLLMITEKSNVVKNKNTIPTQQFNHFNFYRLFEAIQATYNIILQCTTLLLLPSWADITASSNRHFDMDDVRYSFDALAQQYIIDMVMSSKREIVIFNSLPYSRREVVRYMINTPTPYVQVSKYQVSF